jgi:hypothetical protein
MPEKILEEAERAAAASGAGLPIAVRSPKPEKVDHPKFGPIPDPATAGRTALPKNPPPQGNRLGILNDNEPPQPPPAPPFDKKKFVAKLGVDLTKAERKEVAEVNAELARLKVMLDRTDQCGFVKEDDRLHEELIRSGSAEAFEQLMACQVGKVLRSERLAALHRTVTERRIRFSNSRWPQVLTPFFNRLDQKVFQELAELKAKEQAAAGEYGSEWSPSGVYAQIQAFHRTVQNRISQLRHPSPHQALEVGQLLGDLVDL